MIDQGLYIILGLVAVFLFIRLAKRDGWNTERHWYAGALVIAAGVYVAFGLVLGGRPLGFELIQLGFFVGVALAGLRYNSLILAGGWLLHSVWDLLHVLPSLSEHAPKWYVTACIAFDVALAAYIAFGHHSDDSTETVVPALTNSIHPE